MLDSTTSVAGWKRSHYNWKSSYDGRNHSSSNDDADGSSQPTESFHPPFKIRRRSIPFCSGSSSGCPSGIHWRRSSWFRPLLRHGRSPPGSNIRRTILLSRHLLFQCQFRRFRLSESHDPSRWQPRRELGFGRHGRHPPAAPFGYYTKIKWLLERVIINYYDVFRESTRNGGAVDNRAERPHHKMAHQMP